MKIVNMTARSIPDVARLEQECFPHPWQEASIEECFQNPAYYFFVAKDDENDVVGYIATYIVRDEAFVENVCVAEHARRQGIGRALVERAIENCEANGASFLSLEVRRSNTAAIGLYTALDFEIEATRKKYYSDPEEDALIMTRNYERKQAEGFVSFRY
ncbi:MAG: ribosomal protein S18-alanine N-acetyltransferase [Clostridia bacterium]|nr:ribosomal protein S18-alanine N-acetyltransferase [Clostridia bacterium]